MRAPSMAAARSAYTLAPTPSVVGATGRSSSRSTATSSVSAAFARSAAARTRARVAASTPSSIGTDPNQSAVTHSSTCSASVSSCRTGAMPVPLKRSSFSRAHRSAAMYCRDPVRHGLESFDELVARGIRRDGESLDRIADQVHRRRQPRHEPRREARVEQQPLALEAFGERGPQRRVARVGRQRVRARRASRPAGRTCAAATPDRCRRAAPGSGAPPPARHPVRARPARRRSASAIWRTGSVERVTESAYVRPGDSTASSVAGRSRDAASAYVRARCSRYRIELPVHTALRVRVSREYRFTAATTREVSQTY